MKENPKSEIRNPNEARSPKTEIQLRAGRLAVLTRRSDAELRGGLTGFGPWVEPPLPRVAFAILCAFCVSALSSTRPIRLLPFGLRSSDFFRPSDLGLRLSAAAFALTLLAVSSLADTNTTATNRPAAAALPEKPREFYNAGTEQLRAGKLRDAEVALMTAAAREQAAVQTYALYNLGQTRFQQGVEALKKSPDPQATKQRGEAAGELADRAIRNADDALASGESAGLLRAYMEGRGARKELREAMKALDKAMEAHRTTLLRWQRSAGDFKSAYELEPVLDDARFNGQVVDRHIAKLVDQQEQLKQCMGGMGAKLANLKMKLGQMKGQMPGGLLPKGGDEDEDEDEDGGKREPQKEEGKGNKEEKDNAPKGERMALTQEEAAMMLNSFKLDANRKLPMGDKETAKPQDKKGKDY